MTTILFIIFAGLAIGCAIGVISQSNPLTGAISLIGVFIALASLYVTLAAPLSRCAGHRLRRRHHGAVIFVIMLLNVEHSETTRRKRLKFLVPVAIAWRRYWSPRQLSFCIQCIHRRTSCRAPISSVGLTHSIGTNLFTGYLLPFEITSILLLMAIVGAMSLARKKTICRPLRRVVPGSTSPGNGYCRRAELRTCEPVETETPAKRHNCGR